MLPPNINDFAFFLNAKLINSVVKFQSLSQLHKKHFLALVSIFFAKFPLLTIKNVEKSQSKHKNLTCTGT